VWSRHTRFGNTDWTKSSFRSFQGTQNSKPRSLHRLFARDFLKTYCTAKFQFLIHNISFKQFLYTKACQPLDMNKSLFYSPVFLQSLYMHFNVSYHVKGLSNVIFHIPLFSNSIIISTSQSFTYHCNILRCRWLPNDVFCSCDAPYILLIPLNSFDKTSLWGPSSLTTKDRGGPFPGGKLAEKWSWPLTYAWCGNSQCVKLPFHSPICLHGVMFNYAQVHV